MKGKYCLTTWVLLFIVYTSDAQASKTSSLYNFVQEQSPRVNKKITVNLFTIDATQSFGKAGVSISQKLLLQLHKTLSLELFRNKPGAIAINIPSATGTGYTLQLIQENINNQPGFSPGTLTGNAVKKRTGVNQGLHYRGYIKNDPTSIASFSVFENGEVMGLFCNAAGNFNLGKIAGDAAGYVLYNSVHMTVPLSFECKASATPPRQILDHPAQSQQTLPPVTGIVPPLLCKKVRIYWEADYKLYSNDFNSDLVSTSNYLTGLFNQVAVMYQNEGILIELTDTYIWTTPDPYNTSSSSSGLDDFQARWNALGDSFDADLAVLIDGTPTNNGGIAYLLTNALCNRFYAYGYANMYGFYNAVPVYSWDVEVVTHEMGHLVGSNHTQWCGWNTAFGGGCGAIDNCYQVESAGAGCTTCGATTNTNPTAPAGFKGTVMSYCHLRSGIGINLANGFGPLPQAAIRNTINNASCAPSDSRWTGTISTAWENPANWNCGSIPDINTDVTIPSGLTNYPVINSAARCRRINQQPNTNVLVNTNFTLLIAGQQ